MSMYTLSMGQPMTLLQKRGPSVVLVGLTSYGAKAFAVTQIGMQTFPESFLGPPVVPPENVLRDLHRAHFLASENASFESRTVERGNILVWEQPLADRLAGRPLTIEARLDTQSILYRTLWLFGLMIVVVLVLFATLLLWLVHRTRQHPPAAPASAAGHGVRSK